jgi:hypothetical protein
MKYNTGMTYVSLRTNRPGEEYPFIKRSSRADFLAENGFPEAAEAVRGHTDLPPSATAETRILYLADKYVNGTEVEPLRERKARALEKFSSDKTALENASRRVDTALEIEAAVENLTGVRPLLLSLL